MQAQKEDPDIGFILEKLAAGMNEKPAWEDVALKSQDIKTLWGQWPRLAVRDGLMKRRFEAADGLCEKWQVVWPKKLNFCRLRMAACPEVILRVAEPQ